MCADKSTCSTDECRFHVSLPNKKNPQLCARSSYQIMLEVFNRFRIISDFFRMFLRQPTSIDCTATPFTLGGPKKA
ncbi:hypothetical protein Agau_L101780 [Agrobacterium tumefaciens F2]|nr:hypothetical protein Agau_L101780 [Agrobacterium tumefaciens F2]